MAEGAITVRQATIDDQGAVASLVRDLLFELSPAYLETLDFEAMKRATRELLADGQGLWAFLATTAEREDVGVATLNECAAIYALGRFGEICELYVKPAYRSSRVGAKLIDATADFGCKREWRVIEVGAPDVPKWRRTVDFYLRYGFTEIGPRLELKLTQTTDRARHP